MLTRTLPTSVTNKIAEQYGIEPVLVLKVYWDGTSATSYADKDFEEAKGRILEVGEIQTAVPVESVASWTYGVTLDDTDGAIKAIMQMMDIHKVRAVLELAFVGVTERVPLFTGQITSPVHWTEGERALRLNITSDIEHYEVGFSPEEGQLDFVSYDLIGNPWPLCFGSPIHVPATKIKQVERARLIERWSMPDPILTWKLGQIVLAYSQEAAYFEFWNKVRDGIRKVIPPAWWVLEQYIQVLIQIEQIDARIVDVDWELQQARREAQNDPMNVFRRALIVGLNQIIQDLAVLSASLVERKEWIQDLIELVKFGKSMDERAMAGLLEAYDRMRELIGKYVDTQKLICEQNESFQEYVRVLDYHEFPDGVPTYVCIGNTKYLVQFDHTNKRLQFLIGPVNQFVGLPIDVWQPDDEPCGNVTDLDGLDLFWLEDDPAPDLRDMYLLVKMRGGQDNARHILKVRDQKNKKVYFELVQIDTSNADGQRGNTLETIINEFAEPADGWTSLDENNLNFDVPFGLFTGRLDPSIWTRDEVQFAIALLALIPGLQDQEERKAIITLVFLLRWDVLRVLAIDSPGPRDIYTIIGEDIERIEAVSGTVHESWLRDWDIPYEEIPESLYVEYAPGTEIRRCTDTCEIYIANLLPSTIKSVSAYRTNDEGERYLAPIPSRYYIKNEAANLGTYTVTALTFPRALRDIAGENWEDDVYVTLTSSVGPNVLDVLDWLITTYTTKTVNTAQRAVIVNDLDNYPVNFAILDRRNVLDVLAQIAWESRLRITLSNDEFYYDYLPRSYPSAKEANETLIVDQTLMMQQTLSESLVTRYVGKYKETYLPLEQGEREKKIVYRHNVKKYGLHSQDHEFLIYNQVELVEKTLGFWLIRNANTWKQVEFDLPLYGINFQLGSDIKLALVEPYVADVDVNGRCLEATFDPGSYRTKITMDTGVRAGEMLQYQFWYPQLATADPWPLMSEIEQGFAGGYGPGQGVTGTIDDCPPHEDDL